MLLFFLPRYFARQPQAGAKYNISEIKDRCGVLGNVSRWEGSFLRSHSEIKEIVAYLDQRWAAMLAVRASRGDCILIVRHYCVMATRETE